MYVTIAVHQALAFVWLALMSDTVRGWVLRASLKGHKYYGHTKESVASAFRTRKWRIVAVFCLASAATPLGMVILAKGNPDTATTYFEALLFLGVIPHSLLLVALLWDRWIIPFTGADALVFDRGGDRPGSNFDERHLRCLVVAPLFWMSAVLVCGASLTVYWGFGDGTTESLATHTPESVCYGLLIVWMIRALHRWDLNPVFRGWQYYRNYGRLKTRLHYEIHRLQSANSPGGYDYAVYFDEVIIGLLFWLLLTAGIGAALVYIGAWTRWLAIGLILLLVMIGFVSRILQLGRRWKGSV